MFRENRVQSISVKVTDEKINVIRKIFQSNSNNFFDTVLYSQNATEKLFREDCLCSVCALAEVN